jgi:hypothetical protein
MNIHSKNLETRLPLAVLAELDISASAIASAPLPHFRCQIADRY